MTTPFAVAIKLFTVMALLLFMSQIGSFALPEIETQHHHPSSADASFGLSCFVINKLMFISRQMHRCLPKRNF